MAKENMEESRVRKTKVLVLTDHNEFSGYLHHLYPDRRETDILNDDKLFIHLTDVVYRKRGEVPIKKVPFVAVNKSNIVFVIPLEEEEKEEEEEEYSSQKITVQGSTSDEE